MRRDTRRHLWRAACCGLLWQACLGQAQTVAPAATGATTAAAEPGGAGTGGRPYIRPSLSAQALATDHSVTENGKAKGDTVLTVTPALDIFAKGAFSSLEGTWQVTRVDYLRGTQRDQFLPSGSLAGHLAPGEQGLTLDAAVTAAQTRAQYTAAQTSTTTTQSTYTDYRYNLRPGYHAQIGPQAQLDAQLDRVWTQTDRNDTTLADRPDAHSRNDSLRFTRRPTPFGYALEGAYQSTEVAGLSEPTYANRSWRARGLYAFNGELQLGVIGGRETTRSDTQVVSSSIAGLQFQWQPTERTSLQGEAERHDYGRTWRLGVAHRTPWMAFNLDSTRSATTSATSLGTLAAGQSVRDLLNAMLTTRIPDSAARSEAVDALIAQRNLPTELASARALYDLNAQLSQSTAARLAFLGKRDVLAFSAGMNKTQPLLEDQTAVIIGSDTRTHESYFDSELTHQLTPLTSFSGGLRWTRVRSSTALSSTASTANQSHDFSWRLTLNSNLSRQTTATWGLRQLTSRVNDTPNNEKVMYVGLGYRF
jgi:uncharacterized protein (PEP-CTERM system associated)